MKQVITFVVAFLFYFIPYSAFTTSGASGVEFNTGFACVILIVIAMILNKK